MNILVCQKCTKKCFLKIDNDVEMYCTSSPIENVFSFEDCYVLKLTKEQHAKLLEVMRPYIYHKNHEHDTTIIAFKKEDEKVIEFFKEIECPSESETECPCFMEHKLFDWNGKQ